VLDGGRRLRPAARGSRSPWRSRAARRRRRRRTSRRCSACGCRRARRPTR
jgi:hypothetical protein